MLACLLFALVTHLDVTVDGPGLTRPRALMRLMDTQAGAAFDPEQLERDLARLRGLGILYDVTAQASPDGKSVAVRASDRWSLLPVLGLRRGGGRTTARVGVTDHNVGGELFTAYGELTSNAEVPFVSQRSGDRIGNLVYVEVPRLLGTRVTPGLYWTRDFLDFAAFRDDGSVGYLFDRARYDLRGELRFELTRLVTLLAGVDGRLDRYRTSDVSPSPGAAPRAVDTLWGLAGVQVGYVEQELSQSRGAQLDLTLEAARQGLLSDLGALSGTLRAQRYLVPAPAHNLCLQLLVQATTGKDETFLFRSGGLREIRGFLDAFFTGAFLARANAEWRVDVLRETLVIPFIGQLAAFSDSGWVARRAGAVSGLDYEGPILSVGAGVRLIPIPFARAVARLDVATGLYPRRTLDISFSGQQFF